MKTETAQERIRYGIRQTAECEDCGQRRPLNRKRTHIKHHAPHKFTEKCRRQPV